ncbi:MAG: endopeptidase La [Chitinophagales bacterium]|nr:endopeptidase La [Chitinophagales bacterium]
MHQQFQLFSGNNDDDIEFFPLVPLEEDDNGKSIADENYGEVLPILPLRNTVLFPGVVMPLSVGRDKSVRAIKEANNKNKFIGVLAQKTADDDDPELKDLYKVGTIAKIVKMLKMPDGSTTIIIQGRTRFKVSEYLTSEPHITARIATYEVQSEADENDRFFKALMASIKDITTQIVNMSPNIPPEAGVVLRNIDSPAFLLNFVSSNLNIEASEKQALLEISDLKERATKTLEYLYAELQIAELKDEIQSKARNDMDKQQREYFLNQQIKTIQEELGDSTAQEMNDFEKRAAKKKWSKEVKTVFDKELHRLQRINPMMPDHGVAMNYIELMLDLPWNEFSTDRLDLKRAQAVLDKEHYGLDKVKNRILEYLAVLKLKGDMKSPILCFVGPPGVGKTSLGKSIAHAMKRKYVRMSLGGLRDEAEIRGHRRTYIGAMPGRIIQLLKKVQTSNPVFILDEIEKVGADFRGDPASALLEVLDPEQNSTFHDNYLDVEYDLSNVMFIATANSLNGMHPALLDRMEIIQISGYSAEEKIEIAKTHLVPQQRQAHGLTAKHITLSPKILRKVIDEYTRESGVRSLDRRIATLMRAVAKLVALEEPYNPRLSEADVTRILGVKRHDSEMYSDENPAGVAIGLAWTESGGDILFIETSLSQGKGNLTLTGNLGDVMKESATTALSYLKAHATDLGIDNARFEQTNFHIHVPEGAIPKDGPSAGVTMLSALASALTGRKIRPYIAMTGEITLRGKVLPVGGIKEKVLAARRAGLKEVVLCHSNRKDVEEINPLFISDLQFTYVKTMSEMLDKTLAH